MRYSYFLFVSFYLVFALGKRNNCLKSCCAQSVSILLLLVVCGPYVMGLDSVCCCLTVWVKEKSRRFFWLANFSSSICLFFCAICIRVIQCSSTSVCCCIWFIKCWNSFCCASGTVLCPVLEAAGKCIFKMLSCKIGNYYNS